MNGPGRHVRAYLSLLVALYASVLLAGPIAPYDPHEQNRNAPFAPPTRLHFVDADGRFHMRPFVYRLVGRPGRFDADHLPPRIGAAEDFQFAAPIII